MTRIDAGTLDIGHGFKRFSVQSLIPAWREAHFAAQAAAEIGKSWGEEQADDSHSSFAWFRGEDGRGLEGVPAVGAKPFVARLKFEGLELSVYDGHARTIADFGLAGHTLADAMQWIDGVATREMGPRKQDATPAPDLPEHAVGNGAAFTDDPDGFNDLADLYDATYLMIEKLREGVPAFDHARCWPHHFDLASLAVLATDESGSMTKTVGVGITPPDSVDDAGYWYVSPWARDGVAGSPSYPGLEVGRWIDRGSGVSMAVLPVTELSGEGERSEKLAGFIAQAFNACTGVLDV